MTSTATAIGEIIRAAAEIERLLETHRQASGKGLHEKASTARPPLTDDTLKKIRFIASVRNKSAHDPLYVPDDLPGYLRAAEEVRLDLAPKVAVPPAEVPAAPRPGTRPKATPVPPHSATLRAAPGTQAGRGVTVEQVAVGLRAQPARLRPARATGHAALFSQKSAPRARYASLVLLVFPLTVLATVLLGVQIAAITHSPLTGSAAALAALAVFFVLYAAAPLLALLAGGAAGVWAALRGWELLENLLP